MTRNTALKIAGGVLAVGAAVAGGWALGPVAAIGAGCTVAAGWLAGLFHDKPATKT